MGQERARKNERAILQGIAHVGLKSVAAALDVHESTVSRMKDGEVRRWSVLLSAVGLKVVPVAMKCYRPETIQSILTLAQERLDNVHTADQLVWDE